MNEIEKMYENAGIELNEGLGWVCKNPDHCVYQNLSIVPENCSGCEYFEREMIYPPFTAEKQLKLIKWLAIKLNSNHISYWYNETKDVWIFQWYSSAEFSSEGPCIYGSRNKDFSEALCYLINSLWLSLNSEEKKQIKEILSI